MAQINLLNTSGSSVTSPANGNVAIFSSGSLGDEGLYLKESNGNIIAVGSGGGGGSGTSGSSGSSGTSGVGTDGSSGSSGTSGVDGSSGSSGTSGADGSSGSSGTSGADGNDGSSGSSGTSGADGSSGSSGTSGVGTDGSSGSSGTSGIDGSSGSSGTSGADGSSGSSGTSGADGSSGSSGTSGNSGSSGSSGTSGIGTDGSSGSSGTSGIDGSSGSSGTSGIDGSSGSSGTSGTDGSSGSSGTSGQGVPAGGSTDQVLAKINGTDYNTQWVDAASGGGGASYNPVIRYQVTGGDNTVTVMSSGNVEGGLSWVRTSTTLTITKAAHGLSTGDYVVLRGFNVDYVYAEITVTDTNTFTAQVADSGDTSGSAGAYIPAFDVSSLTDTALTLESPSAGNCQLMSLTHFIDTMTDSSVLVTVPSNALTNGAGGNNTLATRVPPQVRAHDLSSTTATNIGNTTVQFATSGPHNVYTVIGGLSTFDNIIYNLQF